jgi:hypothetical protein
MTLLVAKAKAVGLVAGTAMLTTALVGGGAVAMTAVSHEGEVHEDAAVSEELDPALDPVVLEPDPSDSKTVGIDDPEVPKTEAPKTGAGVLPADFTCDETKNHGQNVSAYARSLPKGPGRGEKISAVAQSDCGKTAENATEVETAEAEEAKKPKVAKEAKPAKPAKAKAEGKAEGKGKGAGAGKPEGKGKSAGAGKPAGKGKGGGRG